MSSLVATLERERKNNEDHLIERPKRRFTLKFCYSNYRRDFGKGNFDGRLDDYWEKQYEDMFRGWGDLNESSTSDSKKQNESKEKKVIYPE